MCNCVWLCETKIYLVVIIIIVIINENLYSAVCTRSTSRALQNKHKQLSTELVEYMEMRRSIKQQHKIAGKKHKLQKFITSLSHKQFRVETPPKTVSDGNDVTSCGMTVPNSSGCCRKGTVADHGDFGVYCIWDDQRRSCRWMSATRWRSLARYDGAIPCCQRFTSTARQNAICSGTCSQCRDHGEVKSHGHTSATHKSIARRHSTPTVVCPTDE